MLYTKLVISNFILVAYLFKEWIWLHCKLFGLVRLLCVHLAPSSLATSHYYKFLFSLPSNSNSVILIVPQPGHVGIISLFSLFFYLLFYVSQRSRDLASKKITHLGWKAGSEPVASYIGSG